MVCITTVRRTREKSESEAESGMESRSGLQTASGMPRRASASHISFDLAGPDVSSVSVWLSVRLLFLTYLAEACLPRPRAVSCLNQFRLPGFRSLLLQSLIVRPLIDFLLRPNLNHRDLFFDYSTTIILSSVQTRIRFDSYDPISPTASSNTSFLCNSRPSRQCPTMFPRGAR